MFYDSVKKAVKSGSNVIVSADQYTSTSIQELIFIALQTKSNITITNCDKLSSSEFEAIADMGKGLVTFDLRKS